MPLVSLYVHLIWSTKYRLPVITKAVEEQLYPFLRAEANRHGCAIEAINSTSDHIHLLVALSAIMTVADLAKQLKGSSAYYVNQHGRSEHTLRWQRGYAAFSVSRWDVKKIAAYIAKQKEHHQENTLISDYEPNPQDACE
jgi:putative transposase